jgi:Penicillin amidase
VPTISGANRADLARALGFLHGQERFFQMDGQRRTAAGELSDLAGPIALSLDRRNRVHRFRSRESVWGPTVGTDLQGRKLAYRWVAHDAGSVGLGAALELERAGSAKEALALAHRLSIPHQNLVALAMRL